MGDSTRLGVDSDGAVRVECAGSVRKGTVLRAREEVEALTKAARPPTVLTIGDRRGRVRDAVNTRGEVALSVDLLPSESAEEGLHFQGDVRSLDGLGPWRRCLAFMPCEQQTVILANTRRLNNNEGFVTNLNYYCTSQF